MYIFNPQVPLSEPIQVLQGDVLGFYNVNETSFVVGRVGVGENGMYMTSLLVFT